MTSNFLNRVAVLFSMITLFLAFNSSTIAQNQDIPNNRNNDESKYNQTAEELTQSLTQKVNLTEEQRQEINTAFIDYQKNIAEVDLNMNDTDRNGKISEMHDGFRTDIENIFNDSQMTVYNEFKDQWWREVETRIHPSTVRQNETQDKKY